MQVIFHVYPAVLKRYVFGALFGEHTLHNVGQLAQQYRWPTPNPSPQRAIRPPVFRDVGTTLREPSPRAGILPKGMDFLHSGTSNSGG